MWKTSEFFLSFFKLSLQSIKITGSHDEQRLVYAFDSTVCYVTGTVQLNRDCSPLLVLSEFLLKNVKLVANGNQVCQSQQAAVNKRWKHMLNQHLITPAVYCVYLWCKNPSVDELSSVLSRSFRLWTLFRLPLETVSVFLNYRSQLDPLSSSYL